LYGKNESSIREVMKNKEKIRASFSLAPQTAKVTSIARDEVLMKVQKALNFWVDDLNRGSLLTAKCYGYKTQAYSRTFKRKMERKRKLSLVLQAEYGCVGVGIGLISKTLKP